MTQKENLAQGLIYDLFNWFLNKENRKEQSENCFQKILLERNSKRDAEKSMSGQN